MISCVICSRTKDITDELKQNIAETIGVDYELVVINNSKNKYSIFSAYNEGVRQTKGDIVCFMHEDVVYKTIDWGKRVETMFLDSTIGCVGIIGSYIMLKQGGYWQDMSPYKTGCVYCGKGYWHNADECLGKKAPSEVAMVDGLWFCIPKSLFSQIQFDEKLYQGFHWYDMDICMQVLQTGKRIMVLRDTEIWHLAHSQINLSFLQNMEIFYKKWSNLLPIDRGIVPDENICRIIESWCKINYLLRKEYCEYRKRIENSVSYKLGNAIAEPYRIIMRLFKKSLIR